MNTETNSIIQGLLFLSTKYPDGKIEGGEGSSGEGDRYISFILKDETTLEEKDYKYLESLDWYEYLVDRDNFGNLRLWRFYTLPFEQDNEDEEWENI